MICVGHGETQTVPGGRQAQPTNRGSPGHDPAVQFAARVVSDDFTSTNLNPIHAHDNERLAWGIGLLVIVKLSRQLGRHGATLIPDGARILTHCNAGGLATSEYGTALAAVFTAHEAGRRVHVYADETRPLLQGARLTTWELMQAGIETTLICDNMAAHVMKTGRVDMVITGADRIAANGDAANKIGTYGLAVLAKHHGIPFYVIAPVSTFDLTLPDGEGIPIEERAPEEVTHWMGVPTAPEGVQVFNPAFDVTPHELIAAIVTERGVITNPDTDRVAAALK